MNILFIHAGGVGNLEWLASAQGQQIERRHIEDDDLPQCVVEADFIAILTPVSTHPNWVGLRQQIGQREIDVALIDVMAANCLTPDHPECALGGGTCVLKAPAGTPVELRCLSHQQRLERLLALVGDEGLHKGRTDDGGVGRTTRFEFRGD